MKEFAIMGLVVLALMGMDILTGYVNAVMHECVSSSKMREGLYKKFASIIVLILALGIHAGGSYIGISDTVCNTVAFGVGGCIGLMELTSVLENCCSINPDLPITRIFSLFGQSDEEGEEV